MMKAQEDPIWARLREESRQKAEAEPILASYLHLTILNHQSLEDALSFHLASKLATANLPAMSIREFMSDAFDQSVEIGRPSAATLKLWSKEIRHHGAYRSPFSTTKDFTLWRPIASPTGSGDSIGKRSPVICRIESLKSLPSISIPQRALARGYSSTTRQVS